MCYLVYSKCCCYSPSRWWPFCLCWLHSLGLQQTLPAASLAFDPAPRLKWVLHAAATKSFLVANLGIVIFSLKLSNVFQCYVGKNYVIKFNLLKLSTWPMRFSMTWSGSVFTCFLWKAFQRSVLAADNLILWLTASSNLLWCGLLNKKKLKSSELYYSYASLPPCVLNVTYVYQI